MHQNRLRLRVEDTEAEFSRHRECDELGSATDEDRDDAISGVFDLKACRLVE
jgi:hypothetical protein